MCEAEDLMNKFGSPLGRGASGFNFGVVFALCPLKLHRKSAFSEVLPAKPVVFLGEAPKSRPVRTPSSVARAHSYFPATSQVLDYHLRKFRLRVVAFQPVLKLINGLRVQLLPRWILAQKDMISGLVRIRTARTVGRLLTLSYLMLKVPDGAAACNMLSVEDTIHPRPRPHRPLECIPVDEVEVVAGQL